MRCPFCNQDNTRVVDSRPVEDTNSIRRRRLCDACGKRFTTYEKVETIPLTVIKKDQNRESYKRSKIQDGVLRACYKRPIPIERVEEMIDSIEGDIFRSEDREISSTKIGEIVMEHLKDLDAKFVKEAKEAGFENLKGHRTVGGMRASIYNAMPYEGVVALVEFMKKFEEENL